MRRILLGIWVLVGLAAATHPQDARAQSQFSPVVKINDNAITGYELDQRVRFLRLLRAPGDLEKQALEALIDDRLRRDEAERAGITVPEEQVAEAAEEFAGRANLSAQEMIAELNRAGVAASTFRDFVESGVLWRAVVREKFASRVQVTESEIDRALALSSRRGSARVLLAELVLPATPEYRAQSEALAIELGKIKSIDQFSAAVRQYSASRSRERGGRLDWVPIGNLPPPIQAQVLTMAPGEVTEPLRVENAIVVFQVRGLEETETPEAETVALEFARYLIPGGRSEDALREAARIRAEVDTCDDLYGIAKNQPPERLLRDTVPAAQVPADIGMELARLDEGEVSTALTQNNGQTLVFLMLCGRTVALGEDVSRDDIRNQLRNQRLVSYADSYLEELRADAYIVYEDPSLRP